MGLAYRIQSPNLFTNRAGETGRQAPIWTDRERHKGKSDFGGEKSGDFLPLETDRRETRRMV